MFTIYKARSESEEFSSPVVGCKMVPQLSVKPKKGDVVNKKQILVRFQSKCRMDVDTW